MIARAARNQIRKRLVKAHQQTAVAKHRQGQMLLNAALWQLVRSMAASKIEDFDESLDATLTLPRDAIEQVPANFALKIESDDDSVSVIATLVKPKSNIILPDGSAANG